MADDPMTTDTLTPDPRAAKHQKIRFETKSALQINDVTVRATPTKNGGEG